MCQHALVCRWIGWAEVTLLGAMIVCWLAFCWSVYKDHVCEIPDSNPSEDQPSGEQQASDSVFRPL